MANRLVEHFWQWSDSGRIPIFCDTTSCTHTLLESLLNEDFGKGYRVLSSENADRYAKLRIMDLTTWLHDHALPRLDIGRKKRAVLLHPTCACQQLGLTPTLEAIARQCADEVVIPNHWGCCAASGDRGFMYPALAESATRDERLEIAGRQFDGAYSLAKTCEIVLTSEIKLNYESVAYLVDESTIAKSG